MTTHDQSGSSWIVVFTETPYAMRIIAVHPAPQDPDVSAELHISLWTDCLSSYAVDATTGEEARRTARQLHDVERIRIVCERRHALRARRRPAPHGTHALTGHTRDLALPRQSAQHADALTEAAIRAGYQLRPSPQRELTFDQYHDQLPAKVKATLSRYTALLATGRTQEAVGLLVNTLAAATSDL